MIHPNWHLLSNHAPLTISIPITEENIISSRLAILKNSEEEAAFVKEAIVIIKNMNTSNLMDRDKLNDIVNLLELKIEQAVTNFIQLISPQPVDRFSQTKLRWKAPNEGYPHICGMYKSNNKRLRYQAISSCKSFVC